jgi:deoxyhypusine synthase
LKQRKVKKPAAKSANSKPGQHARAKHQDAGAVPQDMRPPQDDGGAAHHHAGGGTQRSTKGYGNRFSTTSCIRTVPLDLSKVHSASDLVEAYRHTAIGARQVGEAADILHHMTKDPNCFVVATVSGAMTVAKMGLVLCDMIESGMVQAVVCTGALMAHGFVEASGKLHFRYDPTMTDDELFERGYNRVFDSIELERNLDDVELIFPPGAREQPQRRHLVEPRDHGSARKASLEARPGTRRACARRTSTTCRCTSRRSAIRSSGSTSRSTPIGACGAARSPLRFDPFLDVEHYKNRVIAAKTLGIFTIGGGVPRNWAQQVGPYLDLLQKRAGIGDGLKRFQYGVRICPEPTHWGGLSGCTYSEGVFLGQVHADRRRRPLRRGLCRRDDRLAAGREGGARASGRRHAAPGITRPVPPLIPRQLQAVGSGRGRRRLRSGTLRAAFTTLS